MKKKTSAKKPARSARPKVEQRFCVIGATAIEATAGVGSRHQRTWFKSQTRAADHASEIIMRSKEQKLELYVVKVVAAVAVKIAPVEVAINNLGRLALTQTKD